MKLYFICSPVSGNGGIETVLADVITHLNNKYEITLLLTNDPQNKEWLARIPQNVTILYPNKGKNSAIFLMVHLLHIRNQDKVIILGANLIKYAHHLKKLLFKKWPIISWIHFSLQHQDMFDPQNLLYADYHLAISSRIKQEMIELGIPAKNIYLIYNPISLKDTAITLNTDDTLRLIFMGHITLDGQKNLRELFKGVAAYQQNYGKVKVDLFGSMDEGPQCKAYAKQLGITDCLVWHEWMANPWHFIVKNIKADALILTSKFEGLPMVALEALSYGLPCITSQFDGFNDVIKEGVNGWSYPQGNITRLADQLAQLKKIHFKQSTIKDSISPYYSTNYYQGLSKTIKEITTRH